MPNTFIKIASVTVGAGGAASIDFTSIPATFTDLVVKLSARATASTLNTDLYMNINNNTSSQNWRLLQGFGNGVLSATGSATNGRVGIIPAATATANSFSNIETYIPNYTGNTQKSYSSDSAMETNAVQAYLELVAGINTNTVAVTSLVFSSSSGSFAQHSTATLYGIKKD